VVSLFSLLVILHGTSRLILLFPGHEDFFMSLFSWDDDSVVASFHLVFVRLILDMTSTTKKRRELSCV
jgi:hypothetical protein